MKTLNLTQGKVAIVDNQDFERVSIFRWYAEKVKYTWYARRNQPKDKGKRQTIRLHRFILEVPTGFQVDHINGNGLDCRRANMCLCNHSQNQCNRGRPENNTSGYKGVYLRREGDKWCATIKIDGKQFHLGNYTTPKEAAHAYDTACLEHHGKFARLNFGR